MGHIKTLKSSNLRIHYVGVMLLTSFLLGGHAGSMKETLRQKDTVRGQENQHHSRTRS